MQNVSGSVNGACTAATPAADRWKCFMAQYTFPHVKTPAFVVNSFYDAWQWGAILEMPCKEPGCASKAGCPAGATAALEGLRAGMIGNVSAAIAGGGTQHSGFLYACVTHCGQFSHDDRWGALSVHGRWVMTHPFPPWLRTYSFIHTCTAPSAYFARGSYILGGGNGGGGVSPEACRDFRANGGRRREREPIEGPIGDQSESAMNV